MHKRDKSGFAHNIENVEKRADKGLTRHQMQGVQTKAANQLAIQPVVTNRNEKISFTPNSILIIQNVFSTYVQGCSVYIQTKFDCVVNVDDS
jgi:hypothetical protein